MTESRTWIAFLRAINLGARRKFPKVDIVAAVERAGGVDVATYINTGNVRFTLEGEAAEESREQVELRLEKEFLADRGFEVPTICVTPAELVEVAAVAEELAHADGLHYVSLLKAEPSAEDVAVIETAGREGERAVVRGRAVHLLLGPDYHSAGLSNAHVERRFGVATNRNLNVIRTLAQKWGG